MYSPVHQYLRILLSYFIIWLLINLQSHNNDEAIQVFCMAQFTA